MSAALLRAPHRHASLAELLAHHATRVPDKPAVIYPDGDRMERGGHAAYVSISYAELACRVRACAAGLKAHGIRRGMRTAVLVPPGFDLLTLVFAMMHVGAVPVLTDANMSLKSMLDCTRQVSVEAFIGVPAAHVLRWRRPHAFVDTQPAIMVGHRDGTALGKLIALGATRQQLLPTEAKSDDLALISCTTGGTVSARAAEINVGTLRGMSHSVGQCFFTEAIAHTLVTTPLLGLFAVSAGHTVVMPRMSMARDSATNPIPLADAIRRFTVNALFASPALLDPLAAHLAEAGTRLPSLRLVVSSGAPVRLELMRALRAVLPDRARVFGAYGATEVPSIALLESREALAGPAAGPAECMGVCVGRAALGTSVAVIEVRDGPVLAQMPELLVGAGEIGEIVVSGPAVSPQYFQSPQADRENKIQDGDRRWHRTGDAGWIDCEGRIWLCGRIGHRVRTGSGDLYTVLCEGVFNAHPEVERTALVGVGPQGEQQAVLCVELAPGTDQEEWQRIKGELRELGARYPLTKPIEDFLRRPALPVDIRRNAESLIGWAERQLTERSVPTALALALRAARWPGERA